MCVRAADPRCDLVQITRISSLAGASPRPMKENALCEKR